ncbi:MAG: membrane protein of unknown function [Promethearchaeota archaeon]|jgi:hypothetical protein|nr:MAG: membrane protein of unknown function [Candidatus Lokiarchaeota archaeon]
MNFLAILIASGVFYFIIFFWYWPSFLGNIWLILIEKEEEPKEKIIRDSLLMIPTSLIINFALGYFFDLLLLPDIIFKLIIILVIFGGLILPIAINQSAFMGRTNFKLFLIEYGVYFVAFIASGLIIALWP